MSLQGYVELAVTTNYSFLRGASFPGQFVEQANNLNYAAIGIADRNTLAGVVRAHDAWLRLQPDTPPKLLIGARLVFRDGTPDILAYPRDRPAYGRLCQILSAGKKIAPKGECHLDFKDLEKHRDGLLLIVMPGTDMTATRSLLTRLGRDTWLACSMLHTGEDRRRLRDLRRTAREARVPLIAVNDALYHHHDRRELQDVVTCIREHMTLQEAGRRLETNAERYLKPVREMSDLFRECPDAIAETLRFAETIRFRLDELRHNYPHEPVPPGKTANEHLRFLTAKGLKERYPDGIPPKVATIARKELDFIESREIAHYFLTVHDIVKFARDQNILCQGRGSAANSVVCYALGVTSVDPNKFEVMFDRFLNTERREPPDIDVDFEHERREEVIQYIYKRYGRRRAALTATVISYRSRSAIREVGKVFGLTEDVTGKLADTVWGHHGDELKEYQVRQGERDPHNFAIMQAVHFANTLSGFPRHLSQHVGGFVLTEDFLDTVVPIGPAAMEERSFIEWDKDDLDTLEIMKVDVLALGMLTCIRKAFDLIYSSAKSGKEKKNTLASVPQDDPRVYDMLCRGDAIGVFQVESRAQMNMLPRLKPREFYDLAVEVAIVRPGPIQGGMVHPYLKRRANPSLINFPAPDPKFGPPDELYELLKRTKGVPIFQEQAMRMAIVAAGFTSTEANDLRRAMATFRHVGTMPLFGEKFVNGMVGRGYQREFAQSCFRQIEGFGSYGFPESHAISFALLVYISAWIKKHHPAAFAAALLNSQHMGFYAPAEIVRCARDHGVTVLAPDAAFSDWDSTLERNAAGELCLRLGLRQIDGFAENYARTVMEERGYGYPGFADFARRTALPIRALITLAEADAFRGFGLDRREGLWAVRRLPDDSPLPLFAHEGNGGATPEMGPESIAPLPRMPESQEVVADYQTLRLSLKGYPTQFLRPLFDAEQITSCAGLAALKDGDHARVAGVVLVRQRPGEGTAIFITLSDETGVANLVLWESIFPRFRKEVMGSRLLLAEGKVQKSPEGVLHLMVENLIDRSADLGRLYADEPLLPTLTHSHDKRGHPRNVRVLPPSRDFH
ncbi:MAG TPA: error-prone DNA polymerase [Rhizomicrobium sp.]